MQFNSKKSEIVTVIGPGVWNNLTNEQRIACLTALKHNAVNQYFTIQSYARARATCHQWRKDLKSDSIALKFNIRILTSILFKKTSITIQNSIDFSDDATLLQINQAFVHEITNLDSALGKHLIKNFVTFLNSKQEAEKKARIHLIETIRFINDSNNILSLYTNLPLYSFDNHTDPKEIQILGDFPDWNEKIQILENSHFTAFKTAFELEDHVELPPKASTLICRFLLVFAIMLLGFFYVMQPKTPRKFHVSF